MVESLHNGAKVLLAYFHYCNKGNYPFRMDWTAPDRVNYMELDEEQVNFMRQTSEEISAKSTSNIFPPSCLEPCLSAARGTKTKLIPPLSI